VSCNRVWLGRATFHDLGSAWSRTGAKGPAANVQLHQVRIEKPVPVATLRV
jgi:hypothetical protein